MIFAVNKILIIIMMAAGLQPVVGGNRIRPLPAITPIKLNAEIKKECVMRKKIDLTGQKFNKLTVIKPAGKEKSGNILWECLCECGNKAVISSYNIRSGRAKSCGCLRAEVSRKNNTTHNMTKTPEFKAWGNIKQRCYNKNYVGYKNYGGRGIKVCDRWLDKESGFENFLEDMGKKPGKEYSIDRIDTNGDYTPENCRWATNKEQHLNMRTNKIIIIWNT